MGSWAGREAARRVGREREAWGPGGRLIPREGSYSRVVEVCWHWVQVRALRTREARMERMAGKPFLRRLVSAWRVNNVRGRERGREGERYRCNCWDMMSYSPI